MLAVALAARVDVPVPGTSVPQSAQTLAVLVVGSLLGARWGSFALAAYVLAGGAGAPIFADGASGWAHLIGPTAGYLFGFIVAAGLAGGLADRGGMARFLPALAAMIALHVLILVLGWSRLALSLGPTEAFAAGVTPFLVGGAFKSLLAAVIVTLACRRTTISPSSATP